MMHKVSKVLAGASMAVALTAAGTAQAGHFATITIDDAYGDWAGVPVIDSDPADNVGGVDFFEIQIANDNEYLYIRNTYHTAKALSTFLSIDVDENVATGYDIFGLGLVGAEVSWQNDFPFTNATGVFNDGQGMTGDFFGSGAANLLPYADVVTRELAIKLDITRNIDGSPVFPDDTIKMLFWTDSFSGDVSSVINYTLAVPEPASMAMVGLGGLAMLRRKR